MLECCTRLENIHAYLPVLTLPRLRILRTDQQFLPVLTINTVIQPSSSSISQLPIQPPIHLPISLFVITHLSTHSSIHCPSVHLSSHSLTYPFICLSIYYSSIHPHIHLSTNKQSINSFNYSLTHLHTHPSTSLLIHYASTNPLFSLLHFFQLPSLPASPSLFSYIFIPFL